MRVRWLLLLVVILFAQVLWETRNDLPPVWDMAYHQLRGWEYLQAWRQGNLLREFSQLSSYYPPLYYLQEAVVLSIAPQTQFLALWSNLPGLILLAYCTFRIATFFLQPGSAVLAGLLPLLFPMVAWTSRESLIDVPLSGWAAAAALLILKSEFLRRRGWTLLLGGAIAAGLLTKWTFGLFIFFPLLWAFAYSRDRGKSLRNLVDCLILAVPPVFWWYLPNLRFLIERFAITSEVGVMEGDPGWGSFLAWIYYPRCLSSYYLYLPLTLLMAWAVFSFFAKRTRAADWPGKATPLGFLWWWLLGSLLLLTLLGAKDPRYVMPLVSPLAILLLHPWSANWRAAAVVFALAFLQFLTVSFRLPFLPEKVAVFDLKDDTDYRTLRQEWVLYQSSYFNVAGPPRQENWRYRDILEVVPPAAVVGFVPDLAHFHPDALRLFAIRRGRRQEVRRLGQTEGSVEELRSLPFVIGKTGFQGISYITASNDRVYRRLEELKWPLIRSWVLPDRSQALLWRNPTLSP